MQSGISAPYWRKTAMETVRADLFEAYENDLDEYMHLDRKGIELALQEVDILVASCAGEYNARPINQETADRLQSLIQAAFVASR